MLRMSSFAATFAAVMATGGRDLNV